MSREIDAQIAECIFEISVIEYAGYGPSPRKDICIGEPDIRQHCGQFYRETVENLVPYYSTNLTTALLIVEKLGCWDLQFRGSGNLKSCIIWLNGKQFTSSAETMPLAICIAVLKAKGKK